MAGLLDSLKGALSQRGSDASVLGIDIGSSSIKIVQLRRTKGRAVLETYGELALGPYADIDIGRATNLSAESLAEALSDVMREANTTTKKAGASIPFSSSLLSVIEMPKVSDKQLAKMIPIEARKYIPVPVSEVVLDWFIIPEEEVSALEAGSRPKQAQQKVQVLLLAIHNETLNKYQRILQAAEADVSFFEIEIFSTVRAALGQGIAPVMVIDMGAATTKVYLVEHGIVRLSHIINKGSQDITLSLSQSLSLSVSKAEELKRSVGLLGTGDSKSISEAALFTLEYIFSDANRVLLNYQKKYNKAVSKIVLSGGGAALAGILEYAEKSLQADVELANPFGKLETPAFLENVLKDAGPTFSTATGLALRKLQEPG